MATDDLLAQLDQLGKRHVSVVVKTIARDAAAEVRALTARLDTLDPVRLGAWLMEHRGWDRDDVNELTEAIRAATADPTPGPETDRG